RGRQLLDIEQLQQFGFTSHAPAHTDVIVVPLGGDTSHGIVIASEHG
ncbi:phage baseplate assembly protein domain-containing protein, partial [Kingella kingae]